MEAHPPGVAEEDLAGGSGVAVAHLDGAGAVPVGLQDGAQARSVGLAVDGEAQGPGEAAARPGEVVHLVGGNAQAAGVVVMDDLAFHHEELVLAQQAAVGFVDFVVDGHFHLGATVVQGGEGHLAAPGHLGAHGVDDPGQELGLGPGGDVRQAGLYEARHVLAVALEGMTAEVEAQALLLVHELFAQFPAGHVHEGQSLADRLGAAEEAGLGGVAAVLLGGLHGHTHGSEKARAVVAEAVEGSGADERLDGPAVDDAFVYPAAEVEEVGEGAVRLPRLDDGLV